MLVAPKYNKLDLPVHDPDTFVATAQDLTHCDRSSREAALGHYENPTFVRAAMILLCDPTYAPRSLAGLLERTDRELERVAELCGVTVARHEWGLYPVGGKGREYQHYLPGASNLETGMPRDHILVAETDVIRPASLWMEDVEEEAPPADAIRDGVKQYYREGKGTYQLFDIRQDQRRYAPRTDQFVLGAPVGSPEDQVGTYLVDIEPRFMLTT